MKRRVTASNELTDEQMQAELQAHFEELDNKINRFMRKRPYCTFEEGYCYIEHHSLEGMIRSYIKYYNDNVREYSNGFETDWDPDDVLHILYKNGKIEHIGYNDCEGTKRIKLDGIDSMILDGGWGNAYAGPNCMITNLRETTDYGRYGYKNLEQRYYDDDDIRVDFTV